MAIDEERIDSVFNYAGLQSQLHIAQMGNIFGNGFETQLSNILYNILNIFNSLFWNIWYYTL